MAQWCGRIYLSDKAKSRWDQIRRRVDRGRKCKGLYLITEASNGTDQLDILSFDAYLSGGKNSRAGRMTEKTLPRIAGAAYGYAEALSLLCEMTQDAYRESGQCDLREFLGLADPQKD